MMLNVEQHQKMLTVQHMMCCCRNLIVGVTQQAFIHHHDEFPWSLSTQAL